MVWRPVESVRSRTVSWTEFAEPLPQPPPVEFLNKEALSTIQSYPDLFKVTTPINVERFEALLSSHPNQPFVQSVCRGLREGFWPFANTHYGSWPLTWDNSQHATRSPAEHDFILSQINKELEAGRYSPGFGGNLLPGMYSMPIHAVPKPGTDKHRLVTDHSAGQFALNNMISREDIAGVTLDNVVDLGNALRFIRRTGGDQNLILWKADVSEAYRHMPMHPLWQIKQVVSFGGQRYVDRRNVFGGRASQRIFHAFMSLVTWIAVSKLLIHFLYIYVDDSFSVESEGRMLFYKKYKKHLPSNMVKLLNLWDYLGIPHEERKQVFARELPVIGFSVDPNLMRVRMSDESRFQLISSLREFGQHATRRSLRDFQRIAGHLNWALNVYPLLRPALCGLYAKTTGKLFARALMWVNRDVERELSWAVQHLLVSDGVFFLKSEAWTSGPADASFHVYCDASLVGMAFWFPSLNVGFQARVPATGPACTIFYFEALAVCSGILEASSHVPHGGKLAVFSDSLNTVQLFNSLSALPTMNWMVMLVVDMLIPTSIDCRVFHVSGVRNVVADHLSRFCNDSAIQASPGLSVLPFQPPRNTLGATSK
ncbi:hypothetical protein EDD15DRAFT_2383953 [Pisolithus albus]|nr:hypothetical protein EDD15DRAFT_2383953 [Pisolithus albus]